LIKKFKLIIVVLIFAAAIWGVFEKSKNKPSDDIAQYTRGSKNIECLYYNETDFINIPVYKTNNKMGTIRGCIVPHHLVAKNLIHEVFQNAVKNNYSTIVLMGPDHESTDKGKIFTTLKDWQTPSGILKTDTATTSKLTRSGLVTENNDKLTLEHSTSSIIPFISYYFKDSQNMDSQNVTRDVNSQNSTRDINVVTLVLTKQVKLSDIDKLTELLFECIDINETLFIASVDFSHYLNIENAENMDFISMEAIKNEDFYRIMSFTNDNMDSPVSISAMLKMMKEAGANDKTVLNRSNSEYILQKKIDETTSYITYLFN